MQWAADGRSVAFSERGHHQAAELVFALPPDELFARLPRSVVVTAAHLEQIPGVRKLEGRSGAVLGPGPSLLAYSKETVQRNIFRVPLR